MEKYILKNSNEDLEKFVNAKNSEIEKINLEEQKEEVSREIRIRQTIYSKMVAANKMTLGEKTKKINTMLAVLRTLNNLSNTMKQA